MGYAGAKEAAPIMLEGLKKLEYRGYDSSGIAVMDSRSINTVKKAGRIENIEQYVNIHGMPKGCYGIGHTRWATHGGPSDENAHPHFNESQTIGIVHNGIIENYIELKRKMEKRGYHFCSETDSEVIVHMLDYYQNAENAPDTVVEVIQKVLSRLKGSYALEIMFTAYPDTIYCVRKDSPLVIGTAEDGCYIASDAPAILSYTRTVYYPENGEIVVIKHNNIEFYGEDLELLVKEPIQLFMDENAAMKGKYQHFMLKEIEEQPQAVENLLSRYKRPRALSTESETLQTLFEHTRKIRIVACGSAYHAGIAGKYILESLGGIPAEVDVASEFRYRKSVFAKNELVIIISQSGETADSLAALREAKKQNVPVLAIVNVEGSSIAREADSVVYTCAGPEISVATTKGYSTQLVMMYLIAAEFAVAGNLITDKQYEEFLTEIKGLPDKIQTILEQKEILQKIALFYAGKEHAYFIGRGLDYATALESALKLKEISYIHAEAYAAGELKHGTIALIEEGALVAAIETQPEVYEKMHSNVIETKSRGASLLGVGFEEAGLKKEALEHAITLPTCNPLLSASLAIIPFQLFAYYVSAAKGIDVDKPRNLAKSVTVE